MLQPVNFDYIRYTSAGRAYFQDPHYPDWIQVVENHQWVSKHISSAKRGVLGEDIRKIVDEAERLSTTNRSVTKTSTSSQRPALPSPRHHHQKLSSVTPGHGRVSKRRLLPASSPSTSVSTREYPFHQTPEGYAQSTQSISSYPYRRSDYYSM